MGRYPVSIDKEQKLLADMARLGLVEEDLTERFIRGSGSGGQKINKTSSTVHLVHNTSGLEVRCQQTRSQALNRYYARKELCQKLEAQILGVASAKEQAREKIRRQKRKRSKRQKEKILASKRLDSKKKQNRRKPTGE